MIGQFVPRGLVREVFARAGFRCERCGMVANHHNVNASWSGVQLHHKNGKPWEHTPENLEILCNACHRGHHGEESREQAAMCARQGAYPRPEQRVAELERREGGE